MTCAQCGRPLADHDTTVNDRGQLVRYCPTVDPASPRAVALERIREMRSQLRDAS